MRRAVCPCGVARSAAANAAARPQGREQVSSAKTVVTEACHGTEAWLGGGAGVGYMSGTHLPGGLIGANLIPILASLL
jgi:hypothetical protein